MSSPPVRREEFFCLLLLSLIRFTVSILSLSLSFPHFFLLACLRSLHPSVRPPVRPALPENTENETAAKEEEGEEDGVGEKKGGRERSSYSSSIPAWRKRGRKEEEGRESCFFRPATSDDGDDARQRRTPGGRTDRVTDEFSSLLTTVAARAGRVLHRPCLAPTAQVT